MRVRALDSVERLLLEKGNYNELSDEESSELRTWLKRFIGSYQEYKEIMSEEEISGVNNILEWFGKTEKEALAQNDLDGMPMQ